MLPEKIMQSDLLDILFENRNKNYGAYALRKSYNKRMASAITTTFFVAVAFSVFQFMHHVKDGELMIPVIIDDQIFATIPDNPKPLPKVQPAPHVAATPVKQISNAAPVIVSDDYQTKMHTME